MAEQDKNPPGGLKPKPAELDVETGVSMNLPFVSPFYGSGMTAGGGDRLELGRRDGGDPEPTPGQLAAMRKTDGQARALFRLITLPIRASLKTSTFIPAEGGQAEADFIDKMFNLPPNAGGMTTDFGRFVAQALLACFDGFAAFQEVYWIPEKGPLKGKITLKKMSRRPPETVTFVVDKLGGFNGFRQRATFAGRAVDVYIERQCSWYFACQEEERPYYGVSLFESAYYHYDKKVRLYYVAHLAAQRAAVDTRVGTAGPGASTTQLASFRRALADLGTAQYMLLPNANWTVEALKGGGGFDFLSYINHHNSQMSKSVLAAFFDSSQGGGAADTSLVSFGEQSDTLFMLMLQTLMNDLSAAINTYLIPKFIDWNFGSGKYPTFRWGSFTDEQKAQVNKVFDNLSAAGQALTVTKEFMRELEKKMADELGLEIDWKEVEDREKEEADAAAAQFMAGAQGAVPPGSPGALPLPGAPPGAPGTATAPPPPVPPGIDPATVDVSKPPSQWAMSVSSEGAESLSGDVDDLLLAAAGLLAADA